jgi:hypothetical protein
MNEKLEICVNPWHESSFTGICEFQICPECSPRRQAQLAQLARQAFSSPRRELTVVRCEDQLHGKGAHFELPSCKFPHEVEPGLSARINESYYKYN